MFRFPAALLLCLIWFPSCFGFAPGRYEGKNFGTKEFKDWQDLADLQSKSNRYIFSDKFDFFEFVKTKPGTKHLDPKRGALRPKFYTSQALKDLLLNEKKKDLLIIDTRWDRQFNDDQNETREKLFRFADELGYKRVLIERPDICGIQLWSDTMNETDKRESSIASGTTTLRVRRYKYGNFDATLEPNSITSMRANLPKLGRLSNEETWSIHPERSSFGEVIIRHQPNTETEYYGVPKLPNHPDIVVK